MKGSGPQILVIGAGIIGAAIAYHLARRGAAVTVIDRGAPAGGATADSFAWINASYGNAKPYYLLRVLAMRDYRRLEQELAGALRVKWSGCLSWDLTDAELEDYARGHAAWGYDVRLVEREEIQALEPNLIEPPARAVYAVGEGTVDPVAATRTLLNAAQRLGAEFRPNTEVTDFVSASGRLGGVDTSAGIIEADHVVLAAGVETAGLSSRLAVSLPMQSSPGLLLHCKPAEHLFERVLEGPGLHMKQELDGRIVAATDFGGGPAPNDPEAEGARLLALVKTRLHGAQDLEMERVSIGLRPIPEDGLPAVGFAPGVAGHYLAVLHSGITLSPAIGRFAATEILDGTRVDLLDPFRPARFAGG